MIEAVTSAVSNAQQVRAATDQTATLNSFAASQQAVESVSRGPVAPYLSLNVAVDTTYDTAIFQIRDSGTGDVIDQFPSEPTLQQRQAQAARQEAAREEAARQQQAPSTADVSSTTFQASVIAQQSSAPSLEGSSAGVAQAAVAALSAGAQSGATSSTTSVTA